MVVGVILWVIFLAWLVSSLSPSREMCRDTAGNHAYYCLWVIVFGSALIGGYLLLAQSGHAVLAVVSDIAGIGFGVVRLLMMRQFRQNRHSPDDEKVSA